MSTPAGPHDLWFRANDDGVMQNVSSECKRMNDLLFIAGYQCGTIG